MSTPILQAKLPDAPWMHPATARLPGVQPLDPAAWLLRDEVYAAQMRRRDHLIDERFEDVHAMRPEALAAALEALDAVLDFLDRDEGFAISTDVVRRPDGVAVGIDRDMPLRTVGRLIQSDVCLMQASGPEYLLTGAILCFPASWTLSEKIGRPLTRIHAPVREYDTGMARRVQRLFDAIRPGQPLWRANAILYADAELYQPARENVPRPDPGPAATYVRSERQTLRRLPRSGAVVFGIHTRVVRLADLTPEQRAGLGQGAGR